MHHDLGSNLGTRNVSDEDETGTMDDNECCGDVKNLFFIMHYGDDNNFNLALRGR
jgi:hypothetical protein